MKLSVLYMSLLMMFIFSLVLVALPVVQMFANRMDAICKK